MPPFMFASRLIRGNEENEDKRQEEWCGLTPTSLGDLDLLHMANNTEEATPFQHIQWPDKRCKQLEHSFSDVSQIISTDLRTRSTPIKPKGLRADFVHLLGVGLHSKQSTNPRQHNEKDGFQSRSIRRSLSSMESTHSTEGVPAPTKTIVVVPSMDLDIKELTRMCGCIECYEERQLYHLLLASDPSVRIIYLTSNHVEEKVVGYYLRLANVGSDRFSGVQDKLTRVFVISAPSDKYIPLSEKILEDGNLVKLLKTLIYQRKNPTPNDSAGLCVFTGSDSIDKISRELGLRCLEASGDHLHYGTKQGSREVFAACGVPHPAGTPSAGDDDLLTYGDGHREDKAYWANNHRYIRSSRSLAIGIARQITHGVHPRKWMVKLNQGFSGKGNASIDLTKFQDSRYLSRLDAKKAVTCIAEEIEKEFEVGLHFEDPAMTWNGDAKNVGFRKQIERLGVIAEAFVEGEVPSSPSIQAVIEPNDNERVGGRVSIVSTHEQLLAGQVYQGCINPASESYRAQIMDMGLKVGRYMAARGVVGHFSCDFLATKSRDGEPVLKAVEINLRQGGTTHPQATMALLCGGCVCKDGIFCTNDDEVRTYIATDCSSIRKCNEGQLVDAIESKTDPLARKIRWNKQDRVGVVFHLFKFSNVGRIGFTAIGRSIAESETLFKATEVFLSHV